MRSRRAWRVRDVVSLAALLALAVWFSRQPLLDIMTLGWLDEEQSHIFLAPAVAMWLLWLRRTRLRYVALQPSLIGPAVVAGGWLMSWWGFSSGTQIAWHAGALLTLLGVLLSFTGPAPLRLFAPVFAVLVFMLPVPGALRHAIAHPMQQYATNFTHSMLELMGVIAVKSGNMLTINGQQVAVGEACNGMRMVFALTLIVYAFAFGTPLRPTSRLVIIALSPFIAMLCNVIRLVPTSLIYGYGSVEFAQTFHDVAGWVMLPVALVMLMWVLRTFKWLEFPVTSYRLASQ